MPRFARRAALLHLGAACLAIASLPAAAADPFPTRPVVLVVPFSPGTGVDVVARVLAERLSQSWGVAVTVDNRLGAGGTIGSDFVAKSRADGHTLLFTGPPHYINEFLYRKLPFSPINDFRPVIKVSEAPLALLVGKAAPMGNLKELLAQAKANPGKLSFSSGGNGSTPHLAGALLNSMAGVEIVHVPYKAGAQALTDTLGGQVTMTFTSVVTAVQPLRGGQAKVLAVTGSKRSPLMPEVPTLSEAGLPGYDMVTWNGLLAPKGTPDDVVARIASSVAEIVKDPAVVKTITSNGLDMDVMDARHFSALVAEESRKWQKLVAASGARLD